MKKVFFLNIIILIAANILIKPFYLFGIDRTVQNLVGSTIYGTYIAVFTLTMLFQIVSDLGIRYWNNREVAQHEHLFKKYFANLIVLKVGLAVLYVGACYLAAWVLNYDTYYVKVLTLVVVSNWLADFILYMRTNISGLQYYYRDSFLSILDKLLMIIICSILLWANPFDEPFQIEWFVYAQIVANFISCLVALIFIRKHLKGIQFRFNLPFLLVILRQTRDYTIVVFLAAIYMRADTIMLDRLVEDGANETGIYYAAYRLITAANMVGVLFSGLLLPMFARQIKEKEDISELLSFSFQILYAIAIVVSFCTIFYRNEIMISLYTEGSEYAGSILGIVVISFIAASCMYIFGSLLIANENLKQLGFISFLTAIVNVSLGYLLIPTYKAIGAAITTTATHFFILIAAIYLVIRIFKLKPNYSLLMRLVGFTISVWLINYGISNWLDWEWLQQFITAFVLSSVMIFVFKLIDLKMLIEMVKNK
jgi:O-antigen/teichoic acid export membrane protein